MLTEFQASTIVAQCIRDTVSGNEPYDPDNTFAQMNIVSPQRLDTLKATMRNSRVFGVRYHHHTITVSALAPITIDTTLREAETILVERGVQMPGNPINPV